MADEVRFTLRIPADLHQRVTTLASSDERSINYMYVKLLRYAVTAYEEANETEDEQDHRRSINIVPFQLE